MVCPAMEEDAGEGVEGEEKYDFNMEYIKNIGDIMIKAGAVRPCLQFKITAMAPADLGRIPQLLLKDIFMLVATLVEVTPAIFSLKGFTILLFS